MSAMAAWWTQLPAALQSVAGMLGMIGLAIALSLYVGSVVLVLTIWMRAARRTPPAETQAPLVSWPCLESLELLTPRELVLMLDHLYKVGEVYARRDVRDEFAGALRRRLRQIECQPAEQGTGWRNRG